MKNIKRNKLAVIVATILLALILIGMIAAVNISKNNRISNINQLKEQGKI